MNLHKTIIIYIIFIIVSKMSFSQNFGGCATPTFEESYKLKQFGIGCNYNSDTWLEYRTPEYWIPDANTPLKTILVNWIICRDDNGQNGWQDTQEFRDQVALMFSHLNEWYSNSQPKGYVLTCEPSYTHIHDTRIRFELNEIIFIDNTVFNQTCWANPTILNYIHLHYPDSKNALNHIFTQPSNNCLSNAWGYYSIGVNNSAFVQTWYSMFSEWFVVWDDHINHIAHEYGHAVGLHHTYNTEYLNIHHYDFLDDVFGTCPESTCCSHPPPSTVCYLTYNCFFQYHPEPYPIMSGRNNSRYISPKSAGRMHRALSLYGRTFRVNNRPMHKYVKNNYSSQYQKIISKNKIWDFPIKFYQDILIQPNKSLSIECELKMVPQATFTIQNGSLLSINGTVYMKADNYIIIETGGEMVVTGTLDMGKHGRIIVKPGAKLTVDGGTITSSSDYPWHSIFVEGNRNLPQSFAHQGVLILKNGAVIENGTDAIRMRSMASNWGSNGGIIQATNATFRNNWRNVEFNHYDHPSISWFTNCTFETNAETLHNQHIANVTIWNVQGVTFTNCTIKDTRPNIDYHTPGKSRDGIFTIDASFLVDNCRFDWMKYGIYSTSSVSNRTLKVYDSYFSSFNGVYFNNMNNAHVVGNNFYVKPGYMYRGPSQETYGLYIENSRNFEVTGNVFTSTGISAPCPCNSYGVIAMNTGTINHEIYRNDFSGFHVAVLAIGQNRADHNFAGLQIRCNRFNNTHSNDIMIVRDPSLNPNIRQGIKQQQGSFFPPHSTTNLGGNIFSTNAWYRNYAAPIVYSHHRTQSHPSLIPANFTSNSITLLPRNHSFQYETSCPARQISRSTQMLLAEMDEGLNGQRDAEAQLTKMTDGGNTQLMLQQVEMAGKTDAHDTYRHLMKTSPWLSEKVLVAIAGKQEGFNRAMVRDILVANPQSAKSEKVLSALTNRKDKLSALMMAQVDAGKKKWGEMEIVQQHLASYKTRYELALNAMIRHHMHEGDKNSREAITNLLLGTNDIRYKYLLAELYYSWGEGGRGAELLKSIGKEISRDEDWQLDNHRQYLDYYTLLGQWEDNEAYPGLTGLPEQALKAFEKFVNTGHRVSGKALAILLLNEAIDYRELIYYPKEEEVVKKTAPAPLPTVTSTLQPEEGLQFRVFPNPGRDFITFEWCMDNEPASGSRIGIYNTAGLQVHSIGVNEPCNQLLFSLENLPGGNYVARFVSGTATRNFSFVVSR